MAKKKSSENQSPGDRRRKKFEARVSGEIKEPRDGTKRAVVARLLRRKNGVTVQDVMKELHWSYATAYEGIKLLNTQNGFGLTEDENGRIKLVE